MYTFDFTTNNTPWTVKCGSSFPKLFGAVATSIGHTTKIISGICPDAVSLAHEWFHIATTNTIRYIVSYTIGRLWGDSYRKNQEIGANLFGSLHAKDPLFIGYAATLRAGLPKEWPTETISHTV